MYQLPLEMTLTVGTGCATLFLGFTAWWRNRWATGNLLFALMVFSLSIWTTADWFIVSIPSTQPVEILLWKMMFYATVFFGPALIFHSVSYLAHLPLRRLNLLVYLLSLLSFGCAVVALALHFAGIADFSYLLALKAAAAVGLVMYALAVPYVAFHLYPMMLSEKLSELDRRRAGYGIMILLLFVMAGILQLIIGPIPVGYLMPGVAAAFLVCSLMSFVRASFLDVELGGLEAFFILLAAYAVVMILRAEDTNEIFVTLSGSLIVGLFGVLAIRTVHGERTKRHYLEDANRQLHMLEEAKSDFVDMVAHQLRSPLGAIRGAASMLAAGDFGSMPEKAAKASGQIQDTATRLLSLSDTFLNSSRLEVGAYQSVRVPTDLRQEVGGVLHEMASAAEAKGLKLESDVCGECPQRAGLDREVLENVLFNLVDNAVKYTSQGSVAIKCKKDDDFIYLEVKDTGPGMTTEECRDLFKKFHRGKVGRMHQSDGTGLGLYVAKRLAEAAGGEISVYCAEMGKGTVFTLKMPYDRI